MRLAVRLNFRRNVEMHDERRPPAVAPPIPPTTPAVPTGEELGSALHRVKIVERLWNLRREVQGRVGGWVRFAVRSW